MGTRASFFVGNPEDLEGREWLGCVAYDGYLDGDVGEALMGVKTEIGFRRAIKRLGEDRDDFTDPAHNSFPFPWTDDLYLTDYTYAFFDGRVQVTCFHHGWRDIPKTKKGLRTEDPWPTNENELPRDVKAPTGSGPKGPDSIMLLGLG